jgi:hypothetical protein
LDQLLRPSSRRWNRPFAEAEEARGGDGRCLRRLQGHVSGLSDDAQAPCLILSPPRYYEGGVSSVYLWDTEDGFAGVVLLKKSELASRFVPRPLLMLLYSPRCTSASHRLSSPSPLTHSQRLGRLDRFVGLGTRLRVDRARKDSTLQAH